MAKCSYDQQPNHLSTMKCPRCYNDKTIKYGLKRGLNIKQRYFWHNCRHLFYIKTGVPPVKQVRRFSVRKEIFRQIIRADIAEDKNRLVKEYDIQ